MEVFLCLLMIVYAGFGYLLHFGGCISGEFNRFLPETLTPVLAGKPGLSADYHPGSTDRELYEPARYSQCHPV
jgi:hypothetical protein